MEILVAMAEHNLNHSEYEKSLVNTDLSLKVYDLFRLDKEAHPISNIMKKLYLSRAKSNAELGNNKKAEENFLKAIAFCEKDNDKYELASYFMDLARFEANYNNKYTLAINLYDNAMRYNKEGEKKGNNTGKSFYEQKRSIMLEKSVIYYKIKEYKKALNEVNNIKKMLINDLRFSSSGKTKQTAFCIGSYKMFSYLFKKMGKGESSFDYTEYARLWTFWEYLLRNNVFEGFDINRKYEGDVQKLYQLIEGIGKATTDRKQNMYYNPYEVDSIAVVNAYGKNYYSSNGNIEALYETYKNIYTKLLGTHTDIEKLFDAKITRAKDVRIQKFIPEDTAILVYSMNYNYYSKPILFLITKNRVRKYTELHRTDYSELVKNYTEELKNPDSDNYKSNSEKLYKYLVEPFEKEIDGFKHLLIIPDGALNYLPFETLMKDGKYLTEKFIVSYSPSLTTYRKLIRIEKIRKNFHTKKLPLLTIGGNIYKEKNLQSDKRE
ncbi:MAG: CHAT domain-containing protein, partial [Spirochaetota bacterium]